MSEVVIHTTFDNKFTLHNALWGRLSYLFLFKWRNGDKEEVA